MTPTTHYYAQPPLLRRYRKAALEWTRKRGFDGDELPRGKRYRVTKCPLAQATGLNLCGASPGAISMKDLPRDVRHFVRAFDEGEYPDLVER